ncbi:MAG: LamG-like jellyroll fold domain-containing protein [Candidatus Sumerlaeia bacterium]
MRTVQFTLLLIILMAALMIAGCAKTAEQAAYSWDTPHAKVLPQGDLQWAPHPFVFKVGDSIRYIDYANGDDYNTGLSKNSPWKHHPWDENATGKAALAKGVDTYVFKRGVIYRGALVVKESGKKGKPIRLTSDPSWGRGRATIAGSVVGKEWKKLPADQAPAGMPNPEKVWYIDHEFHVQPRSMWQRDKDGTVRRVHLARTPNWKVSNPDDVKSEWFEWDNTWKETIEPEPGKKQVKVWCADYDELDASEVNAYVGGTVWSEYSGVMGTPYANEIEAYDATQNAIRFAGPWGDASDRAPILHCRYFIENLPQLLDVPGEFFYDPKIGDVGRLYVRPWDDMNPNTTNLEIAQTIVFIDIQNKDYIEISGLAFRFGNVRHWYDRWWMAPEDEPACVKARGNCTNITVKNCLFENIVKAVWFQMVEPTDNMDYLSIKDNQILWTDYGAIQIATVRRAGLEDGAIHQAEVLRNKFYQIGLRPFRAHHGHCLQTNYVRVLEIAGNVLDRIYGAGIFNFGGKGSGAEGIAPFTRISIHHNKVTDPLLNTNDWGGIESWQGGPTYIYNNVSGNPGGYWHWAHTMRSKDPEQRNHTSARFGFAYYLDGAFKQYVFNNIAWGKNNTLGSPLANTAGLQEIIGFQNTVFNNTFYKFAAGSRRQAAQAGRNYYLGNIWQDVSDMYFRHAPPRMHEADQNVADAAAGGKEDEPYNYSTLAFSSNIFQGDSRDFGTFEHTGMTYNSIDSFRKNLKQREPIKADVGKMAETEPLANAQAHDFRLFKKSNAIDMGVQAFVSFGLYGTVGEWNFLQSDAKPLMIFDEHWLMDAAHGGRGTYRNLPRNDLKAHNLSASNFEMGPLEDWVKGALHFNGKNTYCSLSSEIASPTGRPGLDMDINNFLVEVQLKTKAGHTKGGILAKMSDKAGYKLGVNDEGGVSLIVQAGKKAMISSKARINDGKWRHVIAEVDRDKKMLRIYIDGKLDSEKKVDLTGSCRNTADFLVGKCECDNYLAGSIDFMRVARGTLADSRTTIGELYEWQTNGPFLRDFTGQSPQDGSRDAGALELMK